MAQQARVVTMDASKRTNLSFFPAYGSPEFWLWVLVVAEVGFLLWVRTQFKGAHGG